MTEQHALFSDPVWTDAYAEGDRVLSGFTGNRGTVVEVVTGRHLLVKWQNWRNEPDGYIARHSSPHGLIREDS